MSPYLDATMSVEPVDVDLAIAVADVHEDHTVGDVGKPVRTQNTVDPGRRDDHARDADGVVEGGDTAAVVLCLHEPHGVQIDDRDDRAEVACPGGDALPDRPEPDHYDFASVERESRDRGEGGPCLQADVMTIVDQILQCDPVPVQHREVDVEARESVQTRRRRFERTCKLTAGGGERGDEVASHITERIGRLAGQPGERLSVLGGAHPGAGADLDPDRRQVRNRAIVRAVRIAGRHAYPRACPHQRRDDADRVPEDVLTARDGAAYEVGGRDLDTKRSRDRRRPCDPVQFCVVHVTSTSG